MTWVPAVGMAKGQPATGHSDDLLVLQFLLMSVAMCVCEICVNVKILTCSGHFTCSMCFYFHLFP